GGDRGRHAGQLEPAAGEGRKEVADGRTRPEADPRTVGHEIGSRFGGSPLLALEVLVAHDADPIGVCGCVQSAGRGPRAEGRVDLTTSRSARRLGSRSVGPIGRTPLLMTTSSRVLGALLPVLAGLAWIPAALAAPIWSPAVSLIRCASAASPRVVFPQADPFHAGA